ncbi:hypothetical protein SGGMMB4_05007 [Sodalis glossinidius str. 'morsitans']|uniref:Uncharacterized protein n=1 Tax=Sodalis glossinidius (strain morsitans) TaxID=343509 RepID=A0A193QNA8_SODGM|nr:hypothetical protein [Sodalis glossinidius]CRL46400.1 hypothetical protein SGGMMB4_05007 [Sodalis glossinidius str. 'morsitans']
MECHVPTVPFGGVPSKVKQWLLAFSALFNPPGMNVNEEICHALEQRACQRRHLAWNWSFRF